MPFGPRREFMVEIHTETLIPGKPRPDFPASRIHSIHRLPQKWKGDAQSPDMEFNVESG